MAPLNKKIIVVIGATGNQGSSVAYTFLGLPDWHVRCLTRNPSSSASQALSTLGAEIIKGDLSDISSLHQAFEGSNAIFLNTDFWATYLAFNNPETITGQDKDSSSKAGFDKEVLHGKNVAIAAANVSTLERFVYSALGPMRKHSNGKYPNSYHWESKAAIVEYIENEQSALAKKSSFIYLGAYNTNPLITPRFEPTSGNYNFFLPMEKEAKMPIVDPKESTGPFVRALIEDEDAGLKLLAYDSYLSIGEIVNLWAKVSGKVVNFVEVNIDVMHQEFGIPIEVLDAPAFITEFGYTGGIDGIIEPSQLRMKVQTKSFEKWLEERDWKEILDSAEAEIKAVQR